MDEGEFVICSYCKKEIESEPALILSLDSTDYLHFEEPLEDSCYMEFSLEMGKNWMSDFIHSPTS